MKKFYFIVAVLFLFSNHVFSQSAGDFRTNQTGNWNNTATWERYDGATWITPAPTTPTDADGVITISHNVSVTADVTVDQVTFSNGSLITINSGSTLTIANGSGNDLSWVSTNSGVVVNGTLTINSGAIFSGSGGNGSTNGSLVINSGGVVNVYGTISGPGSVGLISTVNSGGSVSVYNGGIFSSTRGNGGTQISISGLVHVADGGAMSVTGAGTLAVNSGGTLELEPTVVMTGNIFTLASGGNLKIGSTSGIASSGASGNIQTSNRNLNIGANYEYNGTANQNTGTGLPTNLTGILTINNSGNTVTLNNARTIANAGSVSLSAGTFAAGTNLTMASTSTITRSEGSMTGTPQGAGTYNVSYTGNSKTTGTELSGTGFNNMSLNLTAGQILSLDQARSIPGVLDLTSGLITTTSTNLLTLKDGATVTNVSDASFVNGPLKKIGNDAFIFPVGKSGTGYQAIEISAPANASDAFIGEYIRASGRALGPITVVGLYGVSNCEYWTLDRVAGSSNVDVRLYWNANSPCGSSYITTLVGLQVSYFDGASWSSSGGNGASGAIPPGSGSVVRNGVSTFGDGSAPLRAFTFGNVLANGSPLPVKFGEIKGYAKNSGVQVDFTIYTEENVNRYEVERSADGRQFSSIGQVAARNLNTKTTYGFFDPSPLAFSNFYRIRNIDNDGKSSYSIIIRVDLDRSSSELSIYPNPVKGGAVSFRMDGLIKGDYVIKVLNSSAQQVYAEKFYHGGGAFGQSLTLPGGLKSGLYFLQVQGEEKSFQKMFLIQ